MYDLSEAENKAAAIPDDPYEKGDKRTICGRIWRPGMKIHRYRNTKIQNCKNTKIQKYKKLNKNTKTSKMQSRR